MHARSNLLAQAGLCYDPPSRRTWWSWAPFRAPLRAPRGRLINLLSQWPSRPALSCSREPRLRVGEKTRNGTEGRRGVGQRGAARRWWGHTRAAPPSCNRASWGLPGRQVPPFRSKQPVAESKQKPQQLAQVGNGKGGTWRWAIWEAFDYWTVWDVDMHGV